MDGEITEDPSTRFYYKMLGLIDAEMQEISDFIQDSPEDMRAQANIIFHNERRLRVKNKINRIIENPLKKCIVFGDTEDPLNNIGLIRYLSTVYDQVTVVSKVTDASFVRSLYKDDPSIQIITEQDPDIPEDVVIIGSQQSDRAFCDPTQNIVGLDFKYKFMYNYIPEDCYR